MKKNNKPSTHANANSKHITLVKDLKDLLFTRANSAANKIAFRYRLSHNEIRNVTFAQFADEVSELSKFLLQQDLQNEHIAIIGNNSYQWIVTFLQLPQPEMLQ